jgi:tetratricopeptide (TPR) repeat protein
MVVLAMLVVLLGLVWRLTVVLGGTMRAGLWAAAWMGTAGLLLDQCWQGKNDVALAMYVTASATLLLAGLRSGAGRWTGAAWFAGLAVGVKFTGGLAIAGLAAALAVFGRRRLSPGRTAETAAWGLAPLAGWLVGSWLFLGNPFHPFLTGVFPDLGWGPFYEKEMMAEARAISPVAALDARDWLAGAWRVFGSNDHGSAVLFGLLPLAVLAARGEGARMLGVACAVAWVLWIPSHRNARYLFPLIPFIVAMAGAGGNSPVPGRPFDSVAGRPRSGSSARYGAWLLAGWGGAWRRAIGGYAVISALAGLAWFVQPDRWPYLLGQEGRAEFLAKKFTTWDAMRRWVNANVPPDGRVLFAGEERRLWFNRRVISSGPVFEPVFWRMAGESRDSAEMRKKARQAGLTHLVDNYVSMEYRRLNWYPGPDWDVRRLAVYRDFARRYFRYVWSPEKIDYDNGGFWAAELSRTPLLPPGRLMFLPWTEGLFAPAQALAKKGRMGEAVWAAERAFELTGGVDESALLLAKFVSLTRNQERVRRLLEPGLRAGFRSDGNTSYYAYACLMTGRLDEAIRWYSRDIGIMPTDRSMAGLAGALMTRGNGLAGRDDWKAALADFQRASALEPGTAFCHWATGNALLHLGRPGEARREAAWARKLLVPGGEGGKAVAELERALLVRESAGWVPAAAR